MKDSNWSKITRDDVLKAIRLFLGEAPGYPSPRSTFLVYDERKLPAKHIRGMAYKVATGETIGKDEFAGGMETVRFFEHLGFEVYYSGPMSHSDTRFIASADDTTNKVANSKPVQAIDEKPVEKSLNTISDSIMIKIPTKGVLEQKNALQRILNKLLDGDLVCEMSFPWLRTPASYDNVYQSLVDALADYRKDISFAKKNVSLRCDFVCESRKMIIEYDERQHFSEARRRSLMAYSKLPVHFDRSLWIKACEDIQAKDGQPYNRDELRAFYDSTRDIEAARNGYSLIRIMHGQIDMEDPNAYQKVEAIVGIKGPVYTPAKAGLKIGLYLQTNRFKNKKQFISAMTKVKKADFDVLVFPEVCYTPFMELVSLDDILVEQNIQRVYKDSLDLSLSVGKAVIVSGWDHLGRLFSVFANSFAMGEETRTAIYYKHTMTEFSPFEFADYREKCRSLFEVIHFKGYRMGMTICYDSNHSIFSRMYGLQEVDILINSTGGNVIYDKWYKYNKARAIENSCFTFVTMGGEDYQEHVNSYVYGISPKGKLLTPRTIHGEADALNIPGEIYIYDTSTDDQLPEPDTSISQIPTLNKRVDYSIPVGDISSVLAKAQAISNNLYVLKKNETNIIFACIDGEDIMKPECVLPLLYDDHLKKYENKKYILVNRHRHLDDEFFRNELSLILKVRAMENFCVVILESDLINNCYQTGKVRTAQVVGPSNNNYNIDLSRAGGPEVIWKDVDGQTKKSWRENLEWLIGEMRRVSQG